MQHPKGYSLWSRDPAKGRTAERTALFEACNRLGLKAARVLMLAATSEYHETSFRTGKYATGSEAPKLTAFAAVLPANGHVYFAGKPLMGSSELTGGGDEKQVR